MNDSIKEQLARMTPKEREYVMKAINDPDLIKDLYDIDFYEVPVTIDEFLTNDDFLGWATNNGKQIYDYWKEQMRDIFDPNNSYSEIALTGCLSGDTVVPLLNGTKPTMEELASVGDLDEYVYSFDVNTNRFVAGHLVKAFTTGIKKVYKITLDNGQSFRATSNHKFMTRDKHWKSIDSGLSVNDSLMPFSRGLANTSARYIISIEYIGEEQVYDLTVEKYHNFALECGIVAHNSIGCGKSHVAVLMLCYCLYKLMCLKDPATYFGLAKGSPIYIVFLNITVQLSSGVAYSKFMNLLLGSPWFMRHGRQSQGLKMPEYIPDNNQIRFTAGSSVQHVIGKDVYCFLMDELNFGKGSGAQVGEKSAMMELYNNVAERVRSRFIVDGKCVGKGFLVSSKKSDYDFLESYIKKQKDNPNVKVCDAVLWKIKPQGTYCGKKFHVAFGGSNMVSKIVDEKNGETIEDYERMGYSIEEVPVEFKSSFELDINAAIQNILGIVVSGNMKFITYNSLQNCINTNITNGFEPNIVTVGCKDKLQLRDFFHPEKFPEELTSLPIFIHLDCSLNGDRTGISAVAVMGYNYVNRYDIVSNTSVPTKELMFRDLFSLGIQAPAGDEISFQKTREFLYYLRNVLEWNIKAISTDGFQSADLRQQLSTMGFQDVTLVSLDRKPDGYLALKSAITEKRLMLPSGMTELEKELVELERDATNGKIDHTVTGCFTGDTKIQLVDGRVLTIEELLLEQEYRQNWVYTMNEEEHIIEPKPIKKVFQTKIAKELVEVTLDNGEKIVCTPEHKFMLRDGKYEESQNLASGTSLMPLYTKYADEGLAGYRLYYEPFENKWHYEHRKFKTRESMSKDTVVHHCNYNKSDNTPSNLKIMSRSDHIALHNNTDKDKYSRVSKTLSKYYENNRDNETFINRNIKISNVLRNRWKEEHPGELSRDEAKALHIKEIEETFGVVYDELTSAEKNAYGTKLARKKDSTIVERTSEKLKLLHQGNNWDNAHKNQSNFQWFTNGVENKYLNLSEEGVEIPEGYHKGRTTHWKNHKVVSVERITRPCRVYDLEIQDNHNFALAAGVIVHNSKDIADGLAGALYNAALHNAEFTFAATEIFGDAISENLDSDEGNEDREMLLSSLITPLSQIAPRPNVTPEQQKQSRDAYNDYTDLLDDMIIF